MGFKTAEVVAMENAAATPVIRNVPKPIIINCAVREVMSSVRRVHVNRVKGLTNAKAFRHPGRLHPEYYPFGNIVMLLKLAYKPVLT